MTADLQNLSITVKAVALKKKALLVTHKILRMFVNTLTVDEKHYLLNRDNSTQPIQTQLYQKQKSFGEFFVCILKIYMKF